MGNFGKTKLIIINKLADLYTNGNKTGAKKILKLIKENKEFREMYVFYDEIEKMYFEDKSLAESYVNTLIGILPEKNNKLIKSGLVINEEYSQPTNPIYDLLDVLCESITLNNAKEITQTKNDLVKHLTTPKEQDSIIENYTMNEKLLYAVLVNNFNEKYLNELTEEQQTELQEILSIDNETLSVKINQLKEETLQKVNTLLTESEGEVTERLNDVKSEVESITTSKYNYFRLMELKNGLEI